MRSDNTGYYSEEDFEREFGDGLNDDLGRSSRTKKSKRNKKRLKNSREPRPGRQKKNSKKKTVIIVLVCIILIALASVALAYGFLMNKLDAIDQRSLAGEDLDIDSQVAEDLKDYHNILLLGIDARSNEDPEATRSDAIIIASINKKTDDVKLISVFRDTYLDIEENETKVLDKATHAHVYGGPVNTIRMLNRNLDLNIESYMRVNWKTVADVVDGMEGIELNVEDAEVAEINRYIPDTNNSLNGDKTLLTKSGKQKLNGVQAVTYCRIRKIDGDEARAKRMRKAINAAFAKAKTLKLSQLNDVANKALPQIATSLSSKDIMGMLLKLNSYNMDGSLGWPKDFEGTLIDGVSYVVPVTLTDNVSKLHEKAFAQKNYKPTDRVNEISEQIEYKSGYSNWEQ